MIKFLFLSFCVTLALVRSNLAGAQTIPDIANDPTWVLVPSMSDEFNGTTVDNVKWAWAPPWGTIHSNLTCLTSNADNRSVSGGSLKLSATPNSSTCFDYLGTYPRPYSTGGIFSYSTIKYGYFEVKIKIPDSNVNNTEGFGPNFWFFKHLDPLDGKYSEIDVFEFDAIDNRHTCNVHYASLYIPPVVDTAHKWVMRQNTNYDVFPNFDNQWHTFSCEWSPDRINFFMDGIYITGTDQYCADQLFLNMILDINVPAGNFKRFSIPSGATWPYTYEIDYVRTYQLQMDCNTYDIVCGYGAPGSLSSVKKGIVFQNNCGIILHPGKHFLRATEFIQIDGDFTVPLGIELNIDTPSCY